MDSEKFLSGGYNQLFITIIAGYISFTFFNPKLFEIFSSLDGCISQDNLFLIFNILYPIIPLVAFYVIALFSKDAKWTGIYQGNKRKHTVPDFTKYLIFLTLVVSILIFLFNGSGNYSTSFGNLKELREKEDIVANMDSLQAQLAKRYLLAKNRYIPTRKAGDTPGILDSISEKTIIEVVETYQIDSIESANMIVIGLYRQAVDAGSYSSYLTTRQLVKNFYDIAKFDLSIEQDKARSVFKDLFTTVRFNSLVVLIIVVVVLIILIVILHRQKREEDQSGKLLTSLLIVYLLISFQMLNDIDPQHINVSKKGFQYANDHWYLPVFAKEMTSNTSSTINYYGDVHSAPTDLTTIDENLKTLIEELDRVEINIINEIRKNTQGSGDTTEGNEEEFKAHLKAFDTLKKGVKETVQRLDGRIDSESIRVDTNIISLKQHWQRIGNISDSISEINTALRDF